DRATGGIASGGAGAANTEVVDFWWADDGHVLLTMGQRFGSRQVTYPTGEIHVLELEGMRVRRVIGEAGQAGIVQDLVPTTPEFASVVDPLPDEPGVALAAVELPDAQPRAQLERLN